MLKPSIFFVFLLSFLMIAGPSFAQDPIPSSAFPDGGSSSSDHTVKCDGNSLLKERYGEDVDKFRLPHQPISSAGTEEHLEFGTELVQEFHNTAACRSITAYEYSKRIFYIYAGVGLGVMVLLALVGKWQWKWFFGFLGGLFVIAAAQTIIEFLN